MRFAFEPPNCLDGLLFGWFRHEGIEVIDVVAAHATATTAAGANSASVPVLKRADRDLQIGCSLASIEPWALHCQQSKKLRWPERTQVPQGLGLPLRLF